MTNEQLIQEMIKRSAADYRKQFSRPRGAHEPKGRHEDEKQVRS
jgi:hypothetical protein